MYRSKVEPNGEAPLNNDDAIAKPSAALNICLVGDAPCRTKTHVA